MKVLIAVVLALALPLQILAQEPPVPLAVSKVAKRSLSAVGLMLAFDDSGRVAHYGTGFLLSQGHSGHVGAKATHGLRRNRWTIWAGIPKSSSCNQ